MYGRNYRKINYVVNLVVYCLNINPYVHNVQNFLCGSCRTLTTNLKYILYVREDLELWHVILSNINAYNNTDEQCCPDVKAQLIIAVLLLKYCFDKYVHKTSSSYSTYFWWNIVLVLNQLLKKYFMLAKWKAAFYRNV